MDSVGTKYNIYNGKYRYSSTDVSKAKLFCRDISKKSDTRGGNKKKQGKRDYIKAAINDFEIGEAGEKIVYNHEKQKLIEAYNVGK